MTNRATWLLAALAMTGMAGAAYAQTTPAADPGPQGGQWHHDDADHGDGDRGDQHHDGGWCHEHWRHHGHRHPHRGIGGLLVHSLHQLNLTDAQKQSVHNILADARTQAQSRRKSSTPPDFAALANPGDPKHAAALQDLQTRIAARIKAEDQIRQQIYGVLTADQKTQLASILAAKQAKFAQHHSAG